MSSKEHWCSHCDARVGIPNVEIWGHISSGEKSHPHMFQEYVAIEIFVCDSCMPIIPPNFKK